MNGLKEAVLRRYTIEELRVPSVQEAVEDTLSFIDIKDVESRHVVLASVADTDRKLNAVSMDHDHDDACDCEKEFSKWQDHSFPLPF